MQTIWKTTLEAKEVQEIELPAEAKFITAQVQHKGVSIWFHCDAPDADPEKEAARKKKTFTFYSFATGHLDDYNLQKCQYLGTVQFNHGHAIFHIFAK